MQVPFEVVYETVVNRSIRPFDMTGVTFLTSWTLESSGTQTAISFVSKTALASRIIVARVINTSALKRKKILYVELLIKWESSSI